MTTSVRVRAAKADVHFFEDGEELHVIKGHYMQNASCEFAQGKEGARVHGIHMVAIAYNMIRHCFFTVGVMMGVYGEGFFVSRG
jgi:hypothetical protein